MVDKRVFTSDSQRNLIQSPQRYKGKVRGCSMTGQESVNGSLTIYVISTINNWNKLIFPLLADNNL